VDTSHLNLGFAPPHTRGTAGLQTGPAVAIAWRATLGGASIKGLIATAAVSGWDVISALSAGAATRR